MIGGSNPRFLVIHITIEDFDTGIRVLCVLTEEPANFVDRSHQVSALDQSAVPCVFDK